MATGDTWGIVGHDRTVSALRRAVAERDISHAYLFTGPDGIGKTTLARSFAQALLCRSDSPPCGHCRSCRLVEAGRHPDLYTVEAERPGGRLKVEQIRRLGQALALTPAIGTWKIAILRRFEEATPYAANALLKTLEEPPAYAVLLVLADDADHLLPTITSRCQHFHLRPVPVATVERALVERWGMNPNRASLLAHLSGGRPGWAVRAGRDESLLERREARLGDLVRLLRSPLVERFRYAEQLARDPTALRETLDLWQTWWRDVMLTASRADAVLTNIDRRAELEEHAARFGIRRSATMVQAIGETVHRLGSNVNPRLAVESLLLTLPSQGDVPSVGGRYPGP